MKKKIIVPLALAVSVLASSVVYISVTADQRKLTKEEIAQYADTSFTEQQVNSQLEHVKELERMRDEYIKKNEKVPLQLEKEIKIHTEIYENEKKSLEKAEVEAEHWARRIISAPKDEKGNPVLPEFQKPLKKGIDPFPAEESWIETIDEDNYARVSTFFHGRSVKDEFHSSTIARGYLNILISGTDTKDPSIGVIYNRISFKDSFDLDIQKYEYPGKGNIVFTEFLDDYKILTFTYGDNQEGYFDLVKNEAVFEKYESKK